jgi:hypothetical protein
MCEQPLGAASLGAACARAQAALSTLCTRRAVMHLISTLSVDASAGAPAEGGAAAGGAAAGGAAAGGAAAGGARRGSSLRSLCEHVEGAAQLMTLLKLAHSAGGAGFGALFEGLATLCRAPPPALSALPAMLCDDAVAHLRRSLEATVCVERRGRVPTHLVERLHVAGAASLLVEPDARCALPAGAKLQVSPYISLYLPISPYISLYLPKLPAGAKLQACRHPMDLPYTSLKPPLYLPHISTTPAGLPRPRGPPRAGHVVGQGRGRQLGGGASAGRRGVAGGQHGARRLRLLGLARAGGGGGVAGAGGAGAARGAAAPRLAAARAAPLRSAARAHRAKRLRGAGRPAAQPQRRGQGARAADAPP